MGYAYYNENDPKAAAWLSGLIRGGHIPKGDVDERSIVDVRGSELARYTQCHFFAGIGGWPYALSIAGWGERPVWTGSCPCQPFSQAGKGHGERDSRHLWPDFRRLIDECGPPTVFGEQVASKAGRGWLDGVRIDLEAMGYAVGAADLCAAGVGAPHIRQRLYWVADSAWGGRGVKRNAALSGHSGYPDRSVTAGWMGDTDITRPQGRGLDPGEHASEFPAGPTGPVGRLGESNGAGCLSRKSSIAPVGYGGSFEPAGSTCGLAVAEYSERRTEQQPGEARCGRTGSGGGSALGVAWGRYDILQCTDGKARRVEAGTFPLAHGIPARMGRLRGYGNAIVPQVAAGFVEAFVEAGG